MRRRCWTGIEWLVLRCGKFVMKRPLSDLRHARKEEDMASKPGARHRGSGRIVGYSSPIPLCPSTPSLSRNRVRRSTGRKEGR
jgi:hypothetical protein